MICALWWHWLYMWEVFFGDSKLCAGLSYSLCWEILQSLRTFRSISIWGLAGLAGHSLVLDFTKLRLGIWGTGLGPIYSTAAPASASTSVLPLPGMPECLGTHQGRSVSYCDFINIIDAVKFWFGPNFWILEWLDCWQAIRRNGNICLLTLWRSSCAAVVIASISAWKTVVVLERCVWIVVTTATK